VDQIFSLGNQNGLFKTQEIGVVNIKVGFEFFFAFHDNNEQIKNMEKSSAFFYVCIYNITIDG